MRLLKANPDGSFSLTEFAGNQIPHYAILSHRWEADNQEVNFQDLSNGEASGKEGYRKLQFCREQAAKDGLEYFWVDSCCIDKMNSTELSAAINSMFRWYRDSIKCYVYLSDVSTEQVVYSRLDTLQELLAPRSVEFFSRDGKRLGDKKLLAQQIHEITRIAAHALHGASLSQFSVDERMYWAELRETKVEEDHAYCLMGIFEAPSDP